MLGAATPAGKTKDLRFPRRGFSVTDSIEVGSIFSGFVAIKSLLCFWEFDTPDPTQGAHLLKLSGMDADLAVEAVIKLREIPLPPNLPDEIVAFQIRENPALASSWLHRS